VTRTSTQRFATALALLSLVLLAGLVVRTVADEQARTDERGDPLYPGRPGAAPGDVELRLGAAAELGDLTATVVGGELRSRITDLEDGGYLVVHVELENTGDSPAAYDRSDWTTRTPFGVVAPAAITTIDDLGSGTIPPGEHLEGRVLFEVGRTTGHFYVALAPPGAEGRPVWRVVVDSVG
jgi:hypothetical protein